MNITYNNELNALANVTEFFSPTEKCVEWCRVQTFNYLAKEQYISVKILALPMVFLLIYMYLSYKLPDDYRYAYNDRSWGKAYILATLARLSVWSLAAIITYYAFRKGFFSWLI